MIRFATLVFALLAAAGAQAQVYKCADAKGNVSYSQTPCPANTKQGAINRTVPPAPYAAPVEGAADKAAKGDAAKSGPKTPAEQEQAYRKRQQDEAKAGKEAAQKAAEAQLKAENCRNAKQRLAQYEMGGRISRLDEKGERYYMDDPQIEAGKVQARAEVSQMCN